MNTNEKTQSDDDSQDEAPTAVHYVHQPTASELFKRVLRILRNLIGQYVVAVPILTAWLIYFTGDSFADAFGVVAKWVFYLVSLLFGYKASRALSLARQGEVRTEWEWCSPKPRRRKLAWLTRTKV